MERYCDDDNEKWMKPVSLMKFPFLRQPVVRLRIKISCRSHVRKVVGTECTYRLKIKQREHTPKDKYLPVRRGNSTGRFPS